MPPTDNGGGAPDDNGGGRSTGADLGILTFALIVTTIAILGIVTGIEVAASKPATSGTCQTKCFAFWKLECPGDRFISTCFGFWTCEQAYGQEIHACGKNP